MQQLRLSGNAPALEARVNLAVNLPESSEVLALADDARPSLLLLSGLPEKLEAEYAE